LKIEDGRPFQIAENANQLPLHQVRYKTAFSESQAALHDMTTAGVERRHQKEKENETKGKAIGREREEKRRDEIKIKVFFLPLFLSSFLFLFPHSSIHRRQAKTNAVTRPSPIYTKGQRKRKTQKNTETKKRRSY
jgi:hypothetical protein